MQKGHTMQYRTLGRTGVQVSTLALGTMNFGAMGRTGQDEVTGLVDTALAGGINLIDTADMYSKGQSEELLGAAIAGRRDDVVLATKGSLPMGADRNQRGGSRRWLTTAVENRLHRLNVGLALGFVTAHRGVTSAPIGPRTPEHLDSQLAADTVLPPDVLDAIDAIVSPGVDLAAQEKNAVAPALADPTRRRR